MDIKFSKYSGIYTLYTEQIINTSIDEAWDFFSSPKNLSKITPKEMSFKITSFDESKMFAGQIITYKVGILPLIKLNWVTEITQVVDKKHFVDEQRFGPYKMWHHEHHFKMTEKGLLAIDKVSYKLPFSWIANLFHNAFIKPKLKGIFEYRTKVLEEKFFPR